jgi:hypothetical protein
MRNTFHAGRLGPRARAIEAHGNALRRMAEREGCATVSEYLERAAAACERAVVECAAELLPQDGKAVA